MSNTLEFSRSTALTMGVELELQIVNARDCDLTRGASDLLRQVKKRGHPGEVKPEITESMIELSTSIHSRFKPMLGELRAIRDVLVSSADVLNLAITGGGAHPFQHWSERHIYDGPRFKHLSDLYGFLAKQFTVFGQHVHIGCGHGDDALYLLHGLSRYVPHFIALSAASPYYQGVDTAFDTSRLTSISAFPLSGRAPFILRWDDFNDYFDKMAASGIVESMKDFYWDIRPKPEYGTVEIRVFDTPLQVEHAAALAAYTQMLCRYLLVERPHAPAEDMYLVYNYNRFQASRFGLDGNFIDPGTQAHQPLREHILSTLWVLEPHARELEAEEARRQLMVRARGEGNDARWMRETFEHSGSLQDLVWQQARRWRGSEADW
jgi:glutamate---cysteine ligase / carboxylate-amine ligase